MTTNAHYYGPQTEYNNTLAGSLEEPDGVLEKRMKVLRAYSTRGQQVEERRHNVMRRIASESQIRPTDRFKYHRQGKFSHPKTALFDKSGQPPKVDRSGWWRKDPCTPGEAQNAAQKRCSSIDAFTGSVRYNLRHNRALAQIRSMEQGSDHGFTEDTFKFLDKASVSKADAHNKVMRQADFLAEATFRNSLRSWD